MSERMDGWRECADPVELAAAVAAGVEVLCVAVDGRTWETGCEDSESFRRCMANGCRYRVPPSWSWSYEPPTTVTGDDLRERIARAAACAYMRVPVEAMDPRIIIEPMWPEVADAVLAVLPPLPAPPPVPPWPGAVLSGLVDEDGVPTWLAQAGQVRGEQVRLMAGSEMWMTCSRGWSAIRWVEVRAPRAVPVPETERVPWWEAVGRVVPDVGTIREVGMSGDQAWVRCGDYDPDGVAPDGTVEVLREDGDA